MRMSDDPNNVLGEYTTDPEWVQASTLEDRFPVEELIETGDYEGQVTNFVTREGTKDPFLGTHLIRLHVQLFNVNGEATRMHFFDVCPRRVTRVTNKGTERQTTESRLWTDLVAATKTEGQTALDTVAAATGCRLLFRLRKGEPKGAYKARNWTDRISGVTP